MCGSGVTFDLSLHRLCNYTIIAFFGLQFFVLFLFSLLCFDFDLFSVPFIIQQLLQRSTSKNKWDGLVEVISGYSRFVIGNRTELNTSIVGGSLRRPLIQAE